MAITLVGAGAWVTLDGVAGSVPVPSGLQPGDLMVLLSVGGPSGPLPVGVPLAAQIVASWSGFGLGGNRFPDATSVYAGWVGASVPSAVQIAAPEARAGWDMCVVAFRGVGSIGRTATGQTVTLPAPGSPGVQVRAGGVAVQLMAGRAVPATGIDTSMAWSATRTLATGALSGPGVARWGWVTMPSGGTAGALGRWTDSTSAAIELVASTAPNPPILIGPDAGDVGAHAPVRFAWQHQPVVEAGFQQRWTVRMQTAGVWRWWSVAAADWAEVETWNTGAAQTLDVPLAKFTLGQDAQWQAATFDGIQQQESAYSTARPLRVVSPPTVTVTGPATPVSNNLAPTVTWTATTPMGGQTAWRAQILGAGGAILWDSLPTSGPDLQVQIPVLAWTRGASYTARVQVQQSGGSWSAWATRAFSVTWTLPTTPTVAAAPAATGVDVTVTATAGTRIQVRRSDDGHPPSMIADMPLTGGTGVLTDVTAPAGTPVVYSARSGTVLDGMALWTDWVAAAALTATDRGAYLASALSPCTTWQQVRLRVDATRTRQREAAVVYGLGDTRPRVTYGLQRGMAGSLTVLAADAAEVALLSRLLESGEPLLVRLPPDVGPAGADPGELLSVAVTTPVTVERLVQAGTLRYREVSADWVEQANPGLGTSYAPQTSIMRSE